MKRAAAAFLALSTAACAGKAVAPVTAPPPKAHAAEPPNIVVQVHEVVSSREEDGISSTWIYAQGKRIGRTPPGYFSQIKRWEGRLPPGNHPLRFERWTMTADDTWEPAPAELQPPERFIRVRRGMRTEVQIRYHDKGRKYKLNIDRVPVSSESDAREK